MDVPPTPAEPTGPPEDAAPARVELAWDPDQHSSATVVHASRTMLVLEAADPDQVLPPLGTPIAVDADLGHTMGRLAEHGRRGRFLLSIGERAVRRALRLRTSLPGSLRSRDLPAPMQVEIADLTTAGARVRGIELAVGSQVTLDFIPPGRTEQVAVRALVAHTTDQAAEPWIGVTFRLVALTGGRAGQAKL
jgi:hypothetical protein